MELKHDWRSFQKGFYPHRRGLGGESERLKSAPMTFVLNGDRIVAGAGEGVDVQNWIGKEADEVIEHFQPREVQFFDHQDIDQWIRGSIDSQHYVDQMDQIWQKASPSRVVGGRRMAKRSKQKPGSPGRAHFLLRALAGWWQRLLPVSFGVFIRIKDDRSFRNLLVTFRRGKLDLYQEPELNCLDQERRKDLSSLVRYTSDHHLVPVQGIEVHQSDWEEWCLKSDPWDDVLTKIKKGRVVMEPPRRRLALLIRLKAYLGI